jgi:hypothetical protein
MSRGEDVRSQKFASHISPKLRRFLLVGIDKEQFVDASPKALHIQTNTCRRVVGGAFDLACDFPGHTFGLLPRRCARRTSRTAEERPRSPTQSYRSRGKSFDCSNRNFSQNLSMVLDVIDFGGLFSGNATGPPRSGLLRLTTTF